MTASAHGVIFMVDTPQMTTSVGRAERGYERQLAAINWRGLPQDQAPVSQAGASRLLGISNAYVDIRLGPEAKFSANGAGDTNVAKIAVRRDKL